MTDTHTPLAGTMRDQLDIGLDLVRTCHNACYQQGGCDQDDVMSIASTLEQAMKLFLEPVREWLDEANAADVDRHLKSGRAAK